MTDMSDCPKCGNILVVGDVDDEISYIRVQVQCEMFEEGLCDFAESREISVGDIREHGVLEDEKA